VPGSRSTSTARGTYLPPAPASHPPSQDSVFHYNFVNLCVFSRILFVKMQSKLSFFIISQLDELSVFFLATSHICHIIVLLFYVIGK